MTDLDSGIAPVAEVEFAARAELADADDERTLTIHLEVDTIDRFDTRQQF